ncbi:hypothetical protein AVEN_254268-1 [Araneus ventricosus]|uniref:Uncharacterized protein n=1 Tax=Araneus ventricosus TaxID=182803 RepID=A0A4Y2M7D5_ARAVE|nr:hypothetical protein AVEN_254268-1 [Araneus ventricosus]
MNERVLCTLLECPFRKRIALVLSVLMATLHLVQQYSMVSSCDWSILIMNLILLPCVRMVVMCHSLQNESDSSKGTTETDSDQKERIRRIRGIGFMMNPRNRIRDESAESDS